MSLYNRTWALEGIEIKRSGDGRTVEAYAAVFETPVEIRDVHGHYMETIARTAFDKALRNDTAPMVLYNHGYTVHNTVDALGSVPIGTPIDIRADRRGLLTVTRYNKSALADAVLESIRNGDIRAQSFRGAIRLSTPSRVPAKRAGEPLPKVMRLELGLTDYGPTPMPAYPMATIVAVRGRARTGLPMTATSLRIRTELMFARHAREDRARRIREIARQVGA